MKQIFLVGLMGSGKTTVGKLLAKELKTSFADTDDLIVSQQGSSIAQIFDLQGEASFRELERKIIVEIEEKVIATGGGLPVYHQLMDVLLEKGIVIYLKIDAQTAMKRLSSFTDRPLLTDEIVIKKQQWSTLLLQRESVYERAHHTIDATLTPKEELSQILNLL
jgi:shikimate kinase